MRRSSQTVSRRGFTLVEILVVIAIIAILVALTAPALMRVMGSGEQTNNTHTIRQLEISLEQFKQKYGIYPPSRIKLCPINAMYNPTANKLDAESLAVLSTIWPRLMSPPASATTPSFMHTGMTAGSGAAAVKLGIDWSGGQAGFMALGRKIVLEGDQCLVFFLGGMPAVNPNGCLGFSTNPVNPAQPGGDRVGPFFDFKADRLYERPLPTWVTANFPQIQLRPYVVGLETIPRSLQRYQGFFSYRDSFSAPKTPVPYAYFSSGRRDNNYHGNTLQTFVDTQAMNLPTRISDCPTVQGVFQQVGGVFVTQGGIWPYAEAMAMATPAQPPRYPNKATYQIISAGRDGKFGTGTTIGLFDSVGVPLGFPTWTSTGGLVGAAATTPEWTDDQANFHNAVLSARAN